MITTVYRTINLNPEPWAMGITTTVRGTGRKTFPKVSPNLQLMAFQEAVREELAGDSPLPWEFVDLKFYFWRRLDRYSGPSGRKVTKHHADATNLQKSLEDALQGILFKNDRGNRKVQSEIVSQSPETLPMILVVAQEYIPTGDLPEVPMEILNQIKSAWNKPGEYEQSSLFDVGAAF